MISPCPAFKILLQIRERLKAPAIEFADPPVRDLVDGHGIEIVQFFAAPLYGGDQIRFLQDAKMLRHCLARHAMAAAQLRERLTAAGTEAIQQLTPRGIGKRAKHRCHAHSIIMQPFGCLLKEIFSGAGQFQV
jgi:hypothetical protein